MDAIEKRARELLAAEIEKIEGYKLAAQIRAKLVAQIRSGSQLGPIMAVCHAAIIAALTPPEGYVMVPVEPTDGEVRIANEAQQDFFDDNFQSEFFSSGHYMEESIRYALRTVRAASSEVP